MASKRSNREVRLLPHGMRDDYREKQIEAIMVEVRKKYKDRIRAAGSREERRALKSECEAEIAERIEPFIRDRRLDTPECL